MAIDRMVRRPGLVALVAAAWLAVPALAQVNQGAPAGQPLGGVPVNPVQPGLQAIPDIAPPPAQRRRNVDFEFGVTLGASYSDNVLLRPQGQDEKGSLIEVAPFATARYDNGRSSAQLRATVGGRRADAQSETLTQTTADVRADTDLYLGGDLRMAADALYARSTETQAIGAALDRKPTKLTNIGFSPYLSGNFDRRHFYKVRYALRGIDPGGEELRNTIQNLAMELRSDPDAATDFGWGIFSDLYRVRYENDASYKNNSIDLVGFYRMSETWRLGVGVNTTGIDILTNGAGENSGAGATVYLNHALGNRRSLSLHWTDTYYGDEISAAGWVRSRRWIGGFEYTKGVEDGNIANALAFNTQEFLKPRTRVARTLAGENEDGPPWARIQDISVLVGAGGLGAPLVYQDKAVIAGGFEGQRNTAVIALYRNELTAAVNNFAGFAGGQTDVLGAKLILGHKITARDSIDFTVDFRDLDSVDPDESGKLTIYSLAYNTKITQSITTTIVVRTYKKSDTPGLNDVRENAISLYFTYRF
ncbi:MAG: hypothetical protein R3E83_11115 [Burkholderiaceae bacterium]